MEGEPPGRVFDSFAPSGERAILGRMMRLSFAAWLALSLLGCGQIRDDLSRAQAQYEEAQYEQALVWLRALEADVPAMSAEQQTRFYYLRGMTAHRLGQKSDARHFLSLAREMAGENGGVLGPTWTNAMQRALDELEPSNSSGT